jgi:two-component system sensor histidine kinase QseC
MKVSIRNRLLFILLTVTAAIWLITAWSGYQETQHEVSEIFDAQIAQSARSMLLLASHELQELADAPANTDHIHFIPDDPTLKSGHPYEQKIAYQIWYLPAHTLVLRSANAPVQPLTDAAEGYSDHSIDGEPWRIFTLTDPQSGYQVQMGESYGLRNHLISHIALRLIMPTLLALPLLALLISFGIHRGLTPLRTLTRAVARRAPDSLEPVVEHDIPREIEPLVEELNHLFQRLQEAFENERRFTADAAHELRTPLAALKVQAQVAQRTGDAQQRQQALDNVLRGVDRATRLVEQLLTLARLDPELGLSQPGRIALYPLASEVIADLDGAARAKRIEVVLAGDEAAVVMGQGDSMRMLITNLVDNALRYTPEEGKVQLAVEHDEEGAIQLTIDDSGPGISEAEREQVFQRFYRGRDVTASGSGLGLSIVRRIADLHGATLSLDRSGLGGLCITIRFPLLK